MNTSQKITRLTEEIKNDKTQGASQLARQTMAVLKFAAEHSQADSVEHFLEELKGVGEGLTAARPAMASIFNIVNRYMGALSPISPDQGVAYFKGLAVSKADELARVFGERRGLILAPMRDLLICLPFDAELEFAQWLLDEFALVDMNALDLPPFALADGVLTHAVGAAPTPRRTAVSH